jgi:hypothetical protein
MNEEFAKIRLKEEFTEARTMTVGSKTIHAKPGESVKVPLSDLQMWLNTDRFDWINEPPPPPDNSDLPQDIPARSVLVREGVTLDQVRVMEKGDLEEINGIGRNLADQILLYFQKQDENDGGEG